MTMKFNIKSTSNLKKERGIEVGGRVQMYIDNETIRLMSAYTPKDSGALIDSANTMTTIGSGVIKQGGSKAPYSRRWYYQKANFTGSPMRGNYWFERMKNNGGKNSILKGAKREAGIK